MKYRSVSSIFGTFTFSKLLILIFFCCCYEVGCVNPYYLHQVRDHHDQHGSAYRQDLHSSKVMLPIGGYEKRTTIDHKKHVSDITTTTARMSMSSSSLRFDRFALGNHGYFSEGINVNTNGLKTLPLFPLQPLDAANDSGVGNSSFSLLHDSPVTYCGDDGGRGQPFINFFSSGSSRFDNSGNGL